MLELEVKRLRARPASTPRAAEHAVDNVLKPAAITPGAAATAEAVLLETAARPRASAGSTARETLKARLAVCVDLAPVKLLAPDLVA